MALYPSIITSHGLGWDHQRIGYMYNRKLEMVLYPWVFEAGWTTLHFIVDC